MVRGKRRVEKSVPGGRMTKMAQVLRQKELACWTGTFVAEGQKMQLDIVYRVL